MQSRLVFVFKYWLAWIFFFELARIFFLLKNSKESLAAGFSEISGSLWNGMRMDASLASYLTLPVIIFCILSLFTGFFRKPVLYKIYTGILLLINLLLVLIDMNLFQAWGYRIDASFLKYLSNPKEVYASVSHLPLFAIMLIFITGYLVFLILSNRRINAWVNKFKPAFNKLWAVLALIIIAGLMIIPLRGGLQLAPLNQSSVYFSTNHFANQAAINAPWNFMHAFTHRANETANPFIYMNDKQAENIVDSLYSRTGNDSFDLSGSKPNIILVIAESFTSKAIGLIKDGLEVTPGMNRLTKQGIYFSDIYASGDRTDKGIVAILSGYPSQPTTSIVKTPSKASKLPMLPGLFRDNGYETAFYYGGELEFANMKAYLLNGGFDRFISISDFDRKDQNSKWGAHDGVVMDRFYTGIKNAKSPYFYTWLTLSSHEPFETPVESVFKGKDDESAFLSSIHYTDSVISSLVTKLQGLPSWNNTILVIVADHGHKLPRKSQRYADFKIPILFLDGRINKAYRDNGTGSQMDIAASVLKMAGLDAGRFIWSRDLLDSNRLKWGYFSFNNGFGYAENSGIALFDNVGKQLIEKHGNVNEAFLNRGKALQQLSFRDYLSK